MIESMEDTSSEFKHETEAVSAPPKALYLLVSLATIIADQWSKVWVRAELPLYYPREVIAGLLNFTHVENSGVAFGWLAANGQSFRVLLLTGLGLFAMAVVGVYYWQTPREERRVLLGLSLILGGAVGNLVDRIRAGQVTDFIDFYVGNYHWHTFNLADTGITIGIGLLTLDILFGRSRESSKPADAAGRPYEGADNAS